MKLTHRDFRPQRRSKYVAQPLKRRPTFRILLLTAIGVAVYLKYDSVVNSKAFQNLRQPRRLVDAMLHQDKPSSAPQRVEGIRWSSDSAEVEADCPNGNVEACLGLWDGLGRESIGALRADVAKAGIQLETDVSNGFKARFLRAATGADPLTAQTPRLELARLEIRGSRGTLVLERPAGGAKAPLCDGVRCLDAIHPRAPFARFRGTESPEQNATESRTPEAALISMDGPAARPVLRGRMVEAPAAMSPDQWVKIYHGENTFSYYRGLSSLRPGLKPGAMLETGDTLGFVAGKEDSSGVLNLRIEKDGMLVDPFAFLGLAPEAVANAPETESAHAR